MTPYEAKCHELLEIMLDKTRPAADRRDAEEQLALVMRFGWHPEPSDDPKARAVNDYD